MIKQTAFFLLSILCVPVLIACGGGDDDSGDDSSGGDDVSSSSPAANGSAGNVNIGAIDVCATLSDADVAAVADQRKLGGGTSQGAKYTVKKTAETYNAEAQKVVLKSGCRVEIDAGGAFGAVVIEVQEADGWNLYAGDSGAKKVAGVGDEAVTVRGATVAKVGKVMLSTGENSLTDEFIVDLYKKMVPGLRAQLK